MDNTKEILELHSKGYTNRYIASKFNITHNTVQRRYLDPNGLSPNGPRKRGLRKTELGIICNKCNIEKLETEFYIYTNKSKESKFGTNCKSCLKQALLKSGNQSLEHFLNKLASHIKSRAKTRDITYELSGSILLNLHVQQEGKCFYSDIEMTWGHGKGRSKTSLSVDRIIPSKGYVENNIVLCINKVNYIKSDVSLEEMEKWMPDWYNRIKKKFKQAGMS